MHYNSYSLNRCLAIIKIQLLLRNCYFYPINLEWKTLILAIPIPTLIRQKAWREERINNINAVIKALVVAINAERDKQNEGVRKSANKTYTSICRISISR